MRIQNHWVFFLIFSAQELVEHFEKHSLSRHFPGMDTVLQTPFRVAVARKASGYVHFAF